MTKIEMLEKEIEALKERIEELEGRPQFVPMPYHVYPMSPPPTYPRPYWPTRPWTFLQTTYVDAAL